MKLMTIFGTRPEIIRLSVTIKQLDRFCEQVLVHTGQNYDENLSDVFLRDLQIRPPDHHMGVRAASFGAQAAQIIERADDLMGRLAPDRCLILGDTNSGLAAIAAARRHIPVYHLEAGNRCYDDRVPEEINRRVIDHCSTVLMPYTHRSKENLIREGFPRERVFVVGNPIREVLLANDAQIRQSDVLERLGLNKGRYFAATLHRAENVDDDSRLRRLFAGLELVAVREDLPIVLSLHPHTADRVRRSGLEPGCGIRVIEPLGFWDFVALERDARCVISDSGTVQEECCIFRVPSVTIRDTTERPETVECGSAILTGSDPETIAQSVRIALGSACDWAPPPEYMESSVSTTITKIVLGYRYDRTEPSGEQPASAT
ncbi:MAG: UDP-N-acetylglucosamine 2-epimerase (non-hydrolyzing) [Chloroflexota bacterium]|nr:UDP-N-acetylglucosamine 2-epimerase (non-hydrolyzing) [Chloroflexota bacterium]